MSIETVWMASFFRRNAKPVAERFPGALLPQQEIVAAGLFDRRGRRKLDQEFRALAQAVALGANRAAVHLNDGFRPCAFGFVHYARSGAKVVEIDLVVALPRERKGEARTTKSAPPTPAPGDIAVLESKARIDAHVLAPAKGNRLGRPETPGDRRHQIWDWDILPSHIRKREEVARSFTGARFHIPRRFAWSQR